MIRSAIALSLLAASACSNAQAASSVLVWPIFQTISENAKGSELWLENRGSAPVNLQLRIFSWDQKESADVYADQNEIVASPPFTTVQPGQRQLVRLMRVSAVPPGKEKSYRIVIDEVPPAQANTQTEKSSAGLKMRMRYVLPLFTYGQGVTPLTQNGSVESVQAALRWSISSHKGRQALCINNTGNQHARMSNVYWANGKAEIPQTQGLLGYVLPQHNICFPVADKVGGATGMRLFARLTDNGKAVEIPANR